MPDAIELVKTIKKAAIEAVESTKPVNVYFGTVVSASPLQINVEQKMLLGKKQLVLARSVTDYETQVTVEWNTESSLTTHQHGVRGSDSNNDTINLTSESANLSHSHAISGKKKIIVHNGLVVGDEVILIRQQEGQKYIVVDRIGGGS